MSFSVASPAGARKPGTEPASHPLHIGKCRVDPDLNRVTGPAGEFLLEPKTMAVLLYLADRPGRVVSADELVQSIWLGRPMGDNPVYRCISQLRRALGDDAKDPAYIATVSKKGWRLIAAVLSVAEARQPGATAEPFPEGLAGAAAGTPVRRRLAWGVGAILAIALGGLFMGTWLRTPEGGLESTDPKRPTLAVLPFRNESAQVDSEYLSDGISEALIHRLGAYRELRLIARTSAFAFKDSGRDVKQVAALLGVDFVLQGHVVLRGDQAVINAELVDAEGFRVWGGAFEHRQGADFTLPADIATAVAQQVVGQTLPKQLSAASPDFAAYQHYLIGHEVMIRRPLGFVQTARAQFDRAIEIDPNFAEAHAGRAVVRLFETGSVVEKSAARVAARADIDRALALDPDSAPAHAAEGLFLHLQSPPDWIGSEAALRRALALDPLLVNAWNWLSSVLREQGKLEEAEETLAQAMRIDPLAPSIGANYALSLTARGHFEHAEAQLKRLMQVPEPARPVHIGLIELYINTARMTEALAAARAYVLQSARQGGELEGLGYLAWVHDLLGDFDRAAFWESLDADLSDQPDLVRVAWAASAIEIPPQGFVANVERFRQAMAAAGLKPEDLSAWHRANLAAQLSLAGEHDSALEVFRPLLTSDRAPFMDNPGPAKTVPQALAWAWLQTGEVENARALLAVLDQAFHQAEKAGRLHESSELYDYALNRVLTGETRHAIELLERAERAGWRNYHGFVRDPRWNAVRSDPRVTAILTRIKRDLDAQRALLAARTDDDDFADRIKSLVRPSEATSAARN